MAENTGRLEESLQRLLEGYGADYEVRRDVRLGGLTAPALAEFHLTEERRLLGFSARGMAGSSEASEYVVFLAEEAFTPQSAQRVFALAEAAERELLRLHDGHGYSLFSVVALTLAPQKEALAAVRRYRLRKSYAHGWGMIRLAVLDLAARKAHCNPDGKELGRLALSRL